MAKELPEKGEAIVYEERIQLGDLNAPLWHYGYIKEKNTHSVYIDWDDPNIGLPEQLDVSEANEKLKKHPFREKRK